MKNILLSLFLMLSLVSVHANEIKEVSIEEALHIERNEIKDNRTLNLKKLKEPVNEVYSTVIQSPVFPGENKGFTAWINKNFKLPRNAKKKKIKGNVIIQFIITEEGIVDSPKIISGVDSEVDNEILRVFSTMPNWNPGKYNGKISKFYNRLSIPVPLEKNKKAILESFNNITKEDLENIALNKQNEADSLLQIGETYKALLKYEESFELYPINDTPIRKICIFFKDNRKALIEIYQNVISHLERHRKICDDLLYNPIREIKDIINWYEILNEIQPLSINQLYDLAFYYNFLSEYEKLLTVLDKLYIWAENNNPVVFSICIKLESDLYYKINDYKGIVSLISPYVDIIKMQNECIDPLILLAYSYLQENQEVEAKELMTWIKNNAADKIETSFSRYGEKIKNLLLNYYRIF